MNQPAIVLSVGALSSSLHQAVGYLHVESVSLKFSRQVARLIQVAVNGNRPLAATVCKSACVNNCCIPCLKRIFTATLQNAKCERDREYAHKCRSKKINCFQTRDTVSQTACEIRKRKLTRINALQPACVE